MLRTDPASVVRRYFPEYERTYQTLGWKMFDSIERVYDNAAARQALGWEPEFTFAEIIRRLNANEDTRSPLAAAVGKKAYHDKDFADTDGPYPVNQS